MDTSPFCLTFGVELEFIARFNPELYREKLLAGEREGWQKEYDSNSIFHHRYGTLVRRHMIQVLNEAGFPTNNVNEPQDFSKWTVYTDDTVAPIDNSMNWYPIELKTPVLVYSGAALETVERVVEVLVSKFNLYTNETCGLHVHVGNQDRGFSLRTMKNFCSLITVFEHQLESLHTPDRLQNHFARSMREVFCPNQSTREKLSTIDKLETVNDLIYRFHSTEDGDIDGYLAFNFCNLGRFHTKPLRTIEFRQHRGTLDPKLITNWVKVACNLVNRSHADSAGFRDLIENHIDDTKYTAMDMFKDLELSDLAEFYGPLVFPRNGTDQNPAVVDKFKKPGVMNVSTPGKYDTLWEKKFAPRPPAELMPYKWSSECDRRKV